MKQVECNKCGKVFEVEGEWGYCPFCENDNVEVFKNQLLNVQIVSSKEITKLHKELALTKKALELACTKLLSIYCSDYCGETSNCEKINCEYKKRSSPDFFKTKAKEMINNG